MQNKKATKIYTMIIYELVKIEHYAFFVQSVKRVFKICECLERAMYYI